MDNDEFEQSHLPQVVEISIVFERGRAGRFDFEIFLRRTGFEQILRQLNPKDSEKTKQNLQRIFNSLTTIWEDCGLIKHVGHKTRTDADGRKQRGRKFKIYEPLDVVTFTATVKIPENNNN